MSIGSVVGSVIAGPFGPLIDVVGKVIDRAIPDKSEAARLRAELEAKVSEYADREATRQHDERMAQVKVNEVEAGSSSWWVAGARPFIIWVCGAALAWNYILLPFSIFAVRVAGSKAVPPVIDGAQLTTLLMALLGYGVLRSVDKRGGVATETLPRMPTYEGAGTPLEPGAPVLGQGRAK